MLAPSTHDDLFATLDSAMVAIEFAHITGDREVHAAAERELRDAVAEALARGYILDALNCEVGDVVQNRHGDTGTIIDLRACPVTPRITVRWDAPTPHPTVFTAADLTRGALGHHR